MKLKQNYQTTRKQTTRAAKVINNRIKFAGSSNFGIKRYII